MPLIEPRVPTVTVDVWAHIVAFTAALDAADYPPIPVHVGEVLDARPATPYWLVIPDPGLSGRDTLAGASSRLDLAIQVKSVGATAREAINAAQRARAALTDVRLAIAGRTAWPIRHVDTLPVQPDPDVTATDGRRLLFAVDTYELSTVPA